MQKLHENRHMQIVKLKRVADKHPVSTLSPKSCDLLATPEKTFARHWAGGAKCVLTIQTSFGKCEHAGRFILFFVLFCWKVQPWMESIKATRNHNVGNPPFKAK
jgi:hypothetical protein